jgi:hypothetical protein
VTSTWSGLVGHEFVGLICGKVASSWVAVPLMRGFRYPMTGLAVPAGSRGAVDAPRRAAAGSVDGTRGSIIYGMP